MGRKILRTGKSAVVSTPAEALEAVGRELSDEVTVTVDRERGRIVLTPATLPGGRPGFLDQVDRFIERYQPALDALAEAQHTAVTATAIFLELNHHRLTASTDEALRFAVQTAGEQAELDEIAAWLEAHSSMA